jgi:hypothetical protein
MRDELRSFEPGRFCRRAVAAFPALPAAEADTHEPGDPMATTEKVTTYTLKQAIAAKVGDHVEIAVEAEDGTRFKIVATAEQLDVLTGDLESILDSDDADAEAAE